MILVKAKIPVHTKITIDFITQRKIVLFAKSYNQIATVQ